MSEELRNLALGKLVLEGESMRFVEEESAFEAEGHEPLALIVVFDYHEPTHDKDTVRITVSAELEGEPLGTAEHFIDDNPVVGDDAMGYVSLPVRVVGKGTFRGKFEAIAHYTRERWDGEDHRETKFVKKGAFTLKIR